MIGPELALAREAKPGDRQLPEGCLLSCQQGKRPKNFPFLFPSSSAYSHIIHGHHHHHRHMRSKSI